MSWLSVFFLLNLSKLFINQYQMLRVSSFIIAILFFSGLSLVHGAEWSINTTVKQDLFYDDNVTMSQNAVGSMAYRIIPVINFLRKTNVSEVKAHASYGTQFYSDVEGLNKDIQGYGINGNYSIERITWGLETNLNIAPARNTAVQDSGNFASTAQKTSWSISPLFSYKLTELDSLNLSPSYSESTYSTSDFSSNKKQNINLAWQRQWTERYSNAISIFYLHNEFGNSDQITANNEDNTGNSGTYDSYGINFSTVYLWSEKWGINGIIGVQKTESETGSLVGTTQKNSSVGFLTNSSISYKGDRITSQFYLNRSLVPSSQGQLQEQSAVGLELNYQITERLAANFLSHYQLSKSVTTNSNNNNNNNNNTTRQNIILSPSLNWNITPAWTLSGSYRYRIQDRDTQDNAIDSNLFMLSINYNWQGLILSR